MDSIQTNSEHATKSTRRHDLDALRAVAMLLGIVLHGILSFCPNMPWPVADKSPHELWFLPFAFIHGFRMPLFFLVSGFFTMMLFRKRGLGSLIWHRVRRILLPLLLGLVTIIPLTHWVNHYVVEARFSDESAAGESDADPVAQFWAAVFAGDAEQVIQQIESGNINVNDRHKDHGATPLNLAAVAGRLDVMEILIEAGAEVDKANKDKNAAIHIVGFTGNYKAFLLLKEAGVDLGQKNGDGSTIRENCKLPWFVTKMIVDALQLPLEKEQVESGRKKILAALDGKPVEAEPGQPPKAKEIEPKKQNTNWLMGKLFSHDLLAHLWFLWSLFLLVLAFALLAAIGKPVGFKLDWLPKWLLMPPVSLLLLIPLTFLAEWFMNPGFGPDTSAGLIPNFLLLAYYGLFFGYGAIYFHCDDQQGRFGWWWFLLVPACLIIFPIALWLQIDPKMATYRWVAILLESVFVWLMIFGSMGFFKVLLSGESKVMRYISDSSYWLYLAHLPLVIWLQHLIRNQPWNGLLKASLVILVASALLLVSYQILVRHTPIGWLLNGKRKPKSKPVAVESIPSS